MNETIITHAQIADMSKGLTQANNGFFELRALAVAAEALLEDCDWEVNEKILSAMKVIRLIAEMAQNMAHEADVATTYVEH